MIPLLITYHLPLHEFTDMTSVILVVISLIFLPFSYLDCTHWLPICIYFALPCRLIAYWLMLSLLHVRHWIKFIVSYLILGWVIINWQKNKVGGINIWQSVPRLNISWDMWLTCFNVLSTGHITWHHLLWPLSWYHIILPSLVAIQTEIYPIS